MTAKEYLNTVPNSFGKDYLCTIGQILYTIRGDWGHDVKSRVECCLTLIKMYRESFLLDEPDEYIDKLENTLKSFDYDDGYFDGRNFRENFPYGYIGIRFTDYGELEDE